MKEDNKSTFFNLFQFQSTVISLLDILIFQNFRVACKRTFFALGGKNNKIKRKQKKTHKSIKVFLLLSVLLLKP